MIKTTITCDICGTVRQETNHWYMAHFGGEYLTICHFKLEDAEDRAHFCGQSCVQKYVEQWMGANHG